MSEVTENLYTSLDTAGVNVVEHPDVPEGRVVLTTRKVALRVIASAARVTEGMDRLVTRLWWRTISETDRRAFREYPDA